MSDKHKKTLQAPFPYFGGKMRIANVVWRYLGDVRHYMEPFFGSGAVLLARPNYDPTKHIETACDADGHIANVWRAIKWAPDEVAEWCDWPVNNVDLHARRQRLMKETEALVVKLLNDETYYNAKLAGYWVWAASQWIGSGMQGKNSPLKPRKPCQDDIITAGQRPHLTDGGTGCHKLSIRQKPASAGQIPHLGNGGTGCHKMTLRQGPHHEDDTTIIPKNENIYAWMRMLAKRLRYVRVVAGDWTRVCGGNWQDKMGTVGIFFDPPYSDSDRDPCLYAQDNLYLAHAVREWCLERGAKKTYRIVLAGYYNEHAMLLRHGWRVYRWKACGGYGNQRKNGENTNRHRETLFISPHCVDVNDAITLFDDKQNAEVEYEND